MVQISAIHSHGHCDYTVDLLDESVSNPEIGWLSQSVIANHPEWIRPGVVLLCRGVSMAVFNGGNGNNTNNGNGNLTESFERMLVLGEENVVYAWTNESIGDVGNDQYLELLEKRVDVEGKLRAAVDIEDLEDDDGEDHEHDDEYGDENEEVQVMHANSNVNSNEDDWSNIPASSTMDNGARRETVVINQGRAVVANPTNNSGSSTDRNATSARPNQNAAASGSGSRQTTIVTGQNQRLMTATSSASTRQHVIATTTTQSQRSMEGISASTSTSAGNRDTSSQGGHNAPSNAYDATIITPQTATRPSQPALLANTSAVRNPYLKNAARQSQLIQDNTSALVRNPTGTPGATTLQSQTVQGITSSIHNPYARSSNNAVSIRNPYDRSNTPQTSSAQMTPTLNSFASITNAQNRPHTNGVVDRHNRPISVTPSETHKTVTTPQSNGSSSSSSGNNIVMSQSGNIVSNPYQNRQLNPYSSSSHRDSSVAQMTTNATSNQPRISETGNNVNIPTGQRTPSSSTILVCNTISTPATLATQISSPARQSPQRQIERPQRSIITLNEQRISTGDSRQSIWNNVQSSAMDMNAFDEEHDPSDNNTVQTSKPNMNHHTAMQGDTIDHGIEFSASIFSNLDDMDAFDDE